MKYKKWIEHHSKLTPEDRARSDEILKNKPKEEWEGLTPRPVMWLDGKLNRTVYGFKIPHLTRGWIMATNDEGVITCTSADARDVLMLIF